MTSQEQNSREFYQMYKELTDPAEREKERQKKEFEKYVDNQNVKYAL